MFSVLGNREVGGRSGTILEGESGANDPVGIALMIGLLELAEGDGGSVWNVALDFSVQMVVGVAVGAAGAALLLPAMRRISLPNEGLYPLRVLAAAGVVYGAATVAHGSGFLAVFVTGLLIGDARAPQEGDRALPHRPLESGRDRGLRPLGLTNIDLTNLLDDGQWLDGLVLAVLLAVVVRPSPRGRAADGRAAPAGGERLFIMWGGPQGAVPILLAAFAVLDGVEGSEQIYNIVFVVVAFSVIVQVEPGLRRRPPRHSHA